ncbi:TetR/AcrR family transcriptional regulator [Nocardia asteroides]|uniref:TetR/AcrR family transcriptional regulator n=1 Tax=Nocardia asteroides TaxID=1824 RepID=UPI0037C7D00B
MAKGKPTRERTVERILQAGAELFTEKGFYSTSVAEICDRAAVSRTSFYANMDDKESVFLILFDRHAEVQLSRIRAILESSDSSQKVVELRPVVSAALESLIDERAWALLSAEFTAHAARNPFVASRLAERDQQIVDCLTEVIAQFGDPGRRAVQYFDTGDGEARAILALYEGIMMQSMVDDTVDPHSLLTSALTQYLA